MPIYEVSTVVNQVEHIERAGGNIVGGRLVSDLRLDQATGAVSAVVSRDREGNQSVHEADAVVFAIGITGAPLASLSPFLGRGGLTPGQWRSLSLLTQQPCLSCSAPALGQVLAVMPVFVCCLSVSAN